MVHKFNIVCIFLHDQATHDITAINLCSIWTTARVNGWGFRPPLCTYRLNWASGTSSGWWDGTALSRYRIWNSIPSSMRPNTLPLGHEGFPWYWIFQEWAEKKQFVSLKLEGQSGVQNRDLRLSKQAALTTPPRPPPLYIYSKSAIWADTCFIENH